MKKVDVDHLAEVGKLTRKQRIGIMAAARMNAQSTKAADRREIDHAWICGFGLALAEINRAWDQPSAVFEVMKNAGFTSINDFKKAGLQEFDLKVLRKIIRSEKK